MRRKAGIGSALSARQPTQRERNGFVRANQRHTEHHAVERLGWLRAAVLGANEPLHPVIFRSAQTARLAETPANRRNHPASTRTGWSYGESRF